MATFKGLYGLSSLYLQNNYIENKAPNSFKECKGLATLSNNKLFSIDTQAFSGLVALKSLYLKYNRIVTLKASVFSDL